MSDNNGIFIGPSPPSLRGLFIL